MQLQTRSDSSIVKVKVMSAVAGLVAPTAANQQERSTGSTRSSMQLPVPPANMATPLGATGTLMPPMQRSSLRPAPGNWRRQMRNMLTNPLAAAVLVCVAGSVSAEGEVDVDRLRTSLALIFGSRMCVVEQYLDACIRGGIDACNAIQCDLPKSLNRKRCVLDIPKYLFSKTTEFLSTLPSTTARTTQLPTTTTTTTATQAPNTTFAPNTTITLPTSASTALPSSTTQMTSASVFDNATVTGNFSTTMGTTTTAFLNATIPGTTNGTTELLSNITGLPEFSAGLNVTGFPDNSTEETEPENMTQLLGNLMQKADLLADSANADVSDLEFSVSHAIVGSDEWNFVSASVADTRPELHLDYGTTRINCDGDFCHVSTKVPEAGYGDTLGECVMDEWYEPPVVTTEDTTEGTMTDLVTTTLPPATTVAVAKTFVENIEDYSALVVVAVVAVLLAVFWVAYFLRWKRLRQKYLVNPPTELPNDEE